MATFDVNVTDGSAEADLDAAILVIDKENERRASLDPPGTPLPKGTNAEIKSSYETVLSMVLAKSHRSYQEQAAREKLDIENVQERWEISSNAQRQAAVDQLAPLS